MSVLWVMPLWAADWPRFRGPNGLGVADVARLPVIFGPQKNVRWKAAVPPGHSSPVLAGGRVFLTAYEESRLLTLAYDAATGKQLWRAERVCDVKVRRIDHATRSCSQ